MCSGNGEIEMTVYNCKETNEPCIGQDSVIDGTWICKCQTHGWRELDHFDEDKT